MGLKYDLLEIGRQLAKQTHCSTLLFRAFKHYRLYTTVAAWSLNLAFEACHS